MYLIDHVAFLKISYAKEAFKYIKASFLELLLTLNCGCSKFGPLITPAYHDGIIMVCNPRFAYDMFFGRTTTSN